VYDFFNGGKRADEGHRAKGLISHTQHVMGGIDHYGRMNQISFDFAAQS
jgi:hypothetical protein